MPAAGPIKVLVVDDVEMIHLVADRVLAKDGFEVLHVKNGMDALVAIQQDPGIRLVILDIMMPDISGLEVMREIAQLYPKPQRPKVCFLSGLRNKEDVVKAIGLGGDDYLVKPIDPDILRTKVRTLLGLHANNEFGVLEVSLRGKLQHSQILPDLIVTKLSETEIVIRSTAAIAPGMVLEVAVPTLAAKMEWAHTLSFRVKECRRQRHAVYDLKTEFVGLPEEFLQKVRSLVIRGEFISDGAAPGET